MLRLARRRSNVAWGVLRHVPMLNARIDLAKNHSDEPQLGRRYRWCLPILLALFALASFTASALAVDFDEAIPTCFGPKGLLRWDNIEGAPNWRGGCVLKYDFGTKLHRASLEPGQHTVVVIPESAVLRISGQHIEPDDVVVWSSNGSGLFRAALSGIARRDGSLLFANSETGPACVRIERPVDANGCIDIALFVSRRMMPTSAFTYQYELKGCGQAHQLSIDGERSSDGFYRLPANHPVQLSVKGPARVRFKMRLLYPQWESRRNQTSELHLRTNQGFEQQLSVRFAPETRHRVVIDGVATPIMSAEAFAYWDIPAGTHQIYVESRADLLLNARSAAWRSALPLDLTNSAGWLQDPPHLWELSEDEIGRLLASRAYPIDHRFRLSLQSARDRRHRDGGLLAWNLMRHTSSIFPGHPAVQDLTRQIQRDHTRAVSLLPTARTSSSEPLSFERLLFSTASLAIDDDPSRCHYFPEQFVDDGLQVISSGDFCVLEPQGTLVYRLPDDYPASHLRVSIDKLNLKTGSTFEVQFDQQPPIVLTYDATRYAALQPSVGETALSLLRASHAADAGTLGGPLAARRATGGAIDVATAEMNVPAGTSWVRVTSHAESETRVALHHRRSRDFVPSEMAFLRETESLTDPAALFTSLLREEDSHFSAPPHDRLKSFQNHFVPLLQQMETDRKEFLRGIQPVVETRKRLPANEVGALLNLAREHSENERWDSAIAAWSRLVSIDGPHRREAVSNRAAALAASGELFLLEIELRGRLVFDDDPSVRHLAFESLMEIYQHENNLLKQRQLLAVALQKSPHPDHVVALAELLASQRRWWDALLLTFCLDPEIRPHDLVARCAYHLRWWCSFEQTIAHLPFEQQQIWQAKRLLFHGRYDEAITQLQGAGGAASDLADHWLAAEAILNGAKHDDVEERIDAIRQWELWQLTQPGPWSWQPSPSIVSTSARVEQLVRYPSDSGQAWFRASPDMPARLIVQGPTKVQLTVRPIHASKDGARIDDWLHVHGSGRRFIKPILENRAHTSATLSTSHNSSPGLRVMHEFEVGPGRHEFVVNAEKHDVLIQASTWAPLDESVLLPRLSPQVVDAVVAGCWGQTQLQCRSCQSKTRCAECIQRVECCGSPRSCCSNQCDDLATIADASTIASELVAMRTKVSSVPYLQPSCPCGNIVDAINLSPAFKAHLRLRTGGFSEGDAALLIGKVGEGLCNSREFPEIVTRLKDTFTLPKQLKSHEQVAWLGLLIDRELWAEAAQIGPLTSRAAQQLQHAALIRQVQRVPGPTTAHAMLLVEKHEQYPWDRDVAKQVDRLMNNGRWQPVFDVNASAGAMLLPSAGPQPSSPTARRRAALARPVFGLPGEPDFVLSGFRRVTLTILESQSVDLELLFQQPQFSFQTQPQLEVEFQIDQQPPTRVLIDRTDDTKRVKAHLSAGQHEIRIRIVNPYLGKYIFLRVFERSENGALISWSERNATPNTRYHVATPEQPVELDVSKPCWLRIEKVVNEVATVEERTFAIGGQSLVLVAPKAGGQALYRIWEFRDGDEKPLPPVFSEPDLPVEPPTRWLSTATSPAFDPAQTLAQSMLAPVVGVGRPAIAPATPVSFELPVDQLAQLAVAPADADIPFVELRDHFALGGQEDGTWGFGAGLFERQPLEDSPFFGGAPDRFVQTHLSYERYRPSTRNYHRTLGVMRFRENSGASFGITHRHWLPITELLRQIRPLKYCCDPGKQPWLENWNTDYKLYAFLQRPSDGVFGYDEQLESALGYQIRLYSRREITDRFDHISSLLFYARWLSLDQIRYLPSRVDQDIYTPFRNEHRTGVSLAEMIRYSPTDHTYFWFRPAVLTNEDLDLFAPDNLSLQFGLATLVDQLQFDVAYRFGRYFRDGNRGITVNQHLVYLDAEIDRWRHAGSRTTLAFNVRHDLGEGDTSAFFTLTRYRSRGRGFRDHHPGQFKFRRLREQAEFRRWSRYEPN